MNFSFRFATHLDLPIIERLLAETKLPAEGIAPHIEHFVLACSGDKPVGVAGLEIHQESALFRSFAVLPEHRGEGLGQALFDRALAHAHGLKIKELFLLTSTAEAYFARRGFQKCARDSAPPLLQSSPEFKSLCPLSASCMRLELGQKAILFPRDTLVLTPDVAGAKMWGVALDKTLLTYFEVAPHCRFDLHAHESEQITLVLEGELFFEFEHGTSCVKNGEVIAIPSHVPHAVFTLDKPVKAIDAWSPVMPQYRNRPSS